MSSKKPSFINRGTYGCVYRPAIPCGNKTSKKNTISKMFKRKSAVQNEKEAHEYMSSIDPTGKFTPSLIETCTVEPSKYLDRGDIQKCPFMESGQEMTQIVYQDAGQELYDVAGFHGFDKVFARMGPLFDGLVRLHDAAFSHFDIKPDNITYNNGSKKVFLIDFGLASSWRERRRPSKIRDILRHPYEFYPPEFQVIGEYINENDKLSIPRKVTRKDLKNLYWKNRRKLVQTAESLESFYGRDRALEEIIHFNVDDAVGYLYPLDQILSLWQVHILVTFDTYMLGVTLLQYLDESLLSGETTPSIRRHGPILDMIARMVEKDPKRRYTPVQARKAYKDILKKYY